MYGGLVAAFSGDADPSGLAMICWLGWGVGGGASLGGMPGWLLGVFLRVRWVIPFVGASLGAVFGIWLADAAWNMLNGLAAVRKVNVQGYVCAGALVLGVAIGLLLCISLVKQDRKPPGESAASQNEPDADRG
jgi:hypothetical protein